MTYTQAKLRISMPDSYSREAVKEAAIWILSRLDSSQQDLDEASICIAYNSGHKSGHIAKDNENEEVAGVNDAGSWYGS